MSGPPIPDKLLLSNKSDSRHCSVVATDNEKDHCSNTSENDGQTWNDPQLGERERVIAALEEAGWVQDKAARLLVMTPRQIKYRIQVLDIHIRRI